MRVSAHIAALNKTTRLYTTSSLGALFSEKKFNIFIVGHEMRGKQAR
jgi:hypothetical protein